MSRLIVLINLQVIFLLVSCSDDEMNCIPKRSVNESFFIGNISELQSTGAHIFNGVGIKGIVVKRNSITPPEFKAYDVQAPHLCPLNECSTLKLDDITLSGCDGSQFLLLEGQPLSMTDRPLIEYRVIAEDSDNIFIGGRIR